MRLMHLLVRQALLAAFIVLPLPVLAEIAAKFDTATGTVVVSGFEADMHDQVLASADLIRLQVAELDTAKGMLITVAQQGDDLVVAPHFPLRAGSRYLLSLKIGTTVHEFDVAPPALEASTPAIIGFSPSQAVIPANTLRLYLQFSEPMARGQLREAVALVRGDGSHVSRPFLDLEAELWDPLQRRVTLLFDPGRIKLGVSPNIEGGAPLVAGQSYRLIVSSGMKSAQGAPIGREVAIAFRAGPAERRPIQPDNWQVLAPKVGSIAPLAITFDRVMDSGTVRRLLTLQAPDGTTVQGEITSDGGSWSLSPDRPWQSGIYGLLVDPELEDASGNTTGSPFDAPPGTVGKSQAATVLSFEIAG